MDTLSIAHKKGKDLKLKI